jgi:glycosyltransferase involved in cell wall biosynthesis
MVASTKLKIAYYLVVALILALSGFWVYLNFSDTEYNAAQATNVTRIQQQLEGASAYDFVVVGNVKNSVRTFRDELLPRINASDQDFLVSAGNAVSDGGEENYRAIYRTFAELTKPFLFTYGENEDNAFGGLRFYDKFGPHFFAFEAADSHFIFLDTTGHTSPAWLLAWLERELQSSTSTHRFVFSGLPLHQKLPDTPAFEEDNYFSNDTLAAQFKTLFAQHEVDVVFSSNLSLFHDTEEDGVRYVTTGGAGGLILDHESSYHHYVTVAVDESGVSIEPVRVDVEQSVWVRTLDSIWSAVFTFFYVSYVRFFLILALLIALSMKLWQLVFEERDYYPDFDLDAEPYIDTPKRVAMFTNNYFPFISGVTISIDRLVKGLRAQGHKLLVVAPTYDSDPEAQTDVMRVRTLFAFGKSREFRFANLFQRSARRQVKAFNPDIIHLHHPFGLGSLGLWLARRKKIPAVYTYHTRLEMYAHYVPLPGVIFRNLISHTMVRRFCNKCDGVVVPTWSVEEYLRVIGVTTRILVQPTGVEAPACDQRDASELDALRAQHQLQPNEKILVTVSRLGKEKNIDFMLHAMARLGEYSEHNYRLLVIGEGTERSVLEQTIADLQLEDKVTLVGGVAPDRVKSYYQLADVFVFASKSETQGMVILEAMSCGLPVVAVRASGIDDVIIDGKTGYKTAEKIPQWNTQLARLLNDETRRAEFAAAATRLAREHDIENFGGRINEFYAELMAARAHGED